MCTFMKSLGTKQLNKKTIEEIDKYKWFESEKAGKDLGMDCVLKWIRQYYPEFEKNGQVNYNSSS